MLPRLVTVQPSYQQLQPPGQSYSHLHCCPRYINHGSQFLVQLSFCRTRILSVWVFPGPSLCNSETPPITRSNDKDMVLYVDTAASTCARSKIGPFTGHAVRDIVLFKSWAFCLFDVIFELWRDRYLCLPSCRNSPNSGSFRNGIDTDFAINANVRRSLLSS